MNLIPFFESSVVIQFHVYAALFALFLGGFVLSVRKGTSRHKFLGRVWGGAMIFVALSSFWIHEINILGPFSPIHLLSILVIVSLFAAIKAVRARKIEKHQSIMKWLFFGGLVLPGLFTFLPGRLMFEVALEPTLEKSFAGTKLPEEIDPVFAAFAAVILGVVIVLISNRMRRSK